MTKFDKVIEVRDLRVKYRNSNEWILKGVNLDIYLNKVVLIIGRSGSGKTTLVRALTGVANNIYGADVRGSIKILGRDLNSYSVDEIREVIQVVNQNPYADFMTLYIDEDIDSVIRFNKVDPDYVDKVFKLFKVHNFLNRNLFELSGGQLKRLAIVKALMFNPTIIIFDEPLMWLDDLGIESVVESIKMLKTLGKTIVVFEHRFKPLLNLVDEVFAIKDGLIKPMDIKSLGISKRPNPLSDNYSFEQIAKEKVIEIRDLWFKYNDDWVLKNLNLAIHRGDIVIIYGRNGSGKSTLLKILAGYLKPKRGIIRISKRIVYVPQNIYLFYTEETLESEINSMCASVKTNKFKCINTMVNTITKDIGLDKVDLNRTPFSLSWGEAIRFAISLSRALDPDTIIMLDEPFTGLTYYERFLLANYLAKLKATMVIATSNRDVIEYMHSANLGLRVYEMVEGQLKEAQANIDSNAISFAYLVKDLLYGDGNEFS